MAWWHLPPYLFPLAQTDPYQNAELFGVIRDPYERMVSEFYYICTLKVFDWRPNQCDRTKLSDAAYMNEWLQRKLRDYRGRGERSKNGTDYLRDNGHFTPQSEFVYGPHDVRVLDHVLRMDDEAFADDFHRLASSFGLERVELKKMNAIGAQERGGSSGNTQHNLGVDDLDSETVELINEVYARDFDVGGYRMRDAL